MAKNTAFSLLSSVILLILSALTLVGQLPAAYALGAGLLLGWFGNAHYAYLETGTIGKWASLLLKIAIVLLGLTLPIGSLLENAQQGFWLTLGVIGGTLLVGLIAAKLLKLNQEQGWLISSGTAICGGSAIAAVASSIKAQPANVVISLAIVFLLNAAALFIYPAIGHWFGLSQNQFGLWAAIGIHDTSSVVGAAAQYGNQALDVATTTKLARALWIIPVALLASISQQGGSFKLQIPWFIVLFIIASIVGSYLLTLDIELEQTLAYLKTLAKNVFALSLLWMGATLNKSALKSLSPKALLLGISLWLAISAISLYLIIRYF
ncbi:YeiH family protein [Kangiella sp. TOML190]|uniref:YeiH family protein n=1 Tax=Kangiella sp. TOML190 TaxID=2931351 RepID=UPI00203CCBBA|nr:putative sulfate exporter family transporter [Kangiella sp. TOML190]